MQQIIPHPEARRVIKKSPKTSILSQRWARLVPTVGPGPKIRKMKITKSTSVVKKNPRTFRRARIGPSRQVVMKEAILAGPGIFSGPKMKKKFKKVSKTAKIRFHSNPPPILPLKEKIGAPHWYQHTLGIWYISTSLSLFFLVRA